MKTDKEYPATHSMSTAWYVADEEGNVAIIDYNDNGPVPWETRQTANTVFGLGCAFVGLALGARPSTRVFRPSGIRSRRPRKMW